MRARTTILLAALLFSFSFSSLAYAQSAAVQETIEDATVNLYCRIKTAGRTYSTTGSGVFIHESGLILTNAHVAQYFLLSTSTKRVQADCEVRGGSPARALYEASLLYLSPFWALETVEATTKKQPRTGTGEYDFALLRVTQAVRGDLPERFSALPIDLVTASLLEGESFTVAGYPAEGKSFKEIQRKLRYLSATPTLNSLQSFERPDIDLLVLSPSVVNASGISGAPIVRSWGGLAGIASTVKDGPSEPEERTLRAITLSYIDKALRSETGRSIFHYAYDPSIPGIDPDMAPFAELRETIERSLRNTRE